MTGPTDDHQAWRAAAEAIDTRQVVFIIGPPKCGTSWLARTLNSHPGAVVRGESHVVPLFAWPMLALAQHYKHGLMKLGAKDIPLAGEDVLHLMRTAVDRVLLGYLRSAGGGLDGVRVVGDKSPGHARHASLLTRLYPGCKLICCTRDVRDAAVSAWSHLKVRDNLEMFAAFDTKAQVAEVYARHHWAELLRFARAAGEAIGPGRYRELAYEEHKADPIGAVAGLLDFLGLGSDRDAARACVEANTFERYSGGRPAGEEAESVVRKGVVGDWTNHFSTEFGEFLRRTSAERLAYGGEVIDNTPRLVWSRPGAESPSAGSTAASGRGSGPTDRVCREPDGRGQASPGR